MSDSSIAIKAPDGSKVLKQGDSAFPLSPADALKQAYDMRLVLSDSDPLREQSYRLRHQVYCIENQFEPISADSDGLETDVYDIQSLHGLLVDRKNGLVAGTARLILPELNGSNVPLPIHLMCDQKFMDQAMGRIGHGRVAEVSRFAVAKALRRRAQLKSRNVDSPDRHRITGPDQNIPHMSIGLLQAIVVMARLGEITHLYAVMEPSLLKMLQLLGIYFDNLGPVVDYHGKRQPCFCDLDHLLATTWKQCPDVWKILTDNGRIWPLDLHKS